MALTEDLEIEILTQLKHAVDDRHSPAVGVVLALDATDWTGVNVRAAGREFAVKYRATLTDVGAIGYAMIWLMGPTPEESVELWPRKRREPAA